MAELHLYRAYGLEIRSELPLPELIRGGSGRDVEIRRARLDAPPLEATGIKRQGIEARFGGTPGDAYLCWPGVATLRARGGDTLLVDADPSAKDGLLSLYVLSEALGLLLHQRGLFLLHGSAVRVGDVAAVLVGPPGVGKSTVAAAFHREGHTVLTDDMVAISAHGDRTPEVLPGFPQIKIWPPAVYGLGFDEDTLTELFPGSAKRVIREPEGFPLEPLPLSHVIYLRRAESPLVGPMTEVGAHLSLTRFFPCPAALLDADGEKRNFAHCARIVASASTWKLGLPVHCETLLPVVQWIAQELASGGLREDPIYTWVKSTGVS